MSSHYKGDPYWTTARFAGKCAKTGEPFAKGARIFYYPRTRACYVGAAAEAVSADFVAAVFDEDQYNSGYINDGGSYCQ